MVLTNVGPQLHANPVRPRRCRQVAHLIGRFTGAEESAVARDFSGDIKGLILTFLSEFQAQFSSTVEDTCNFNIAYNLVDIVTK